MAPTASAIYALYLRAKRGSGRPSGIAASTDAQLSTNEYAAYTLQAGPSGPPTQENGLPLGLAPLAPGPAADDLDHRRLRGRTLCYRPRCLRRPPPARPTPGPDPVRLSAGAGQAPPARLARPVRQRPGCPSASLPPLLAQRRLLGPGQGRLAAGVPTQRRLGKKPGQRRQERRGAEADGRCPGAAAGGLAVVVGGRAGHGPRARPAAAVAADVAARHAVGGR